MKKVLFFILLLWCPFSIVSAQFVNFGQDRPSLRWKQIKTDDFQIIYPDFFEENAQKAASIFSLLYHHANTLQLHPKKISIIMHADGGVSNGNVALAPRKSELYTMPSQDPTDDWLEHLCVHEFRHVVQLDKVNQGLTKDLYYLFGEIFPIAVVGVYVPMWFMEGDAVCFETAVGHLGRGRSPEFLNEMKAQILEKGIYNYSKAVLGSNKDLHHGVLHDRQLPGQLRFGYLGKSAGTHRKTPLRHYSLRHQPEAFHAGQAGQSLAGQYIPFSVYRSRQCPPGQYLPGCQAYPLPG
mgnify:CR=1 FL=1